MTTFLLIHGAYQGGFIWKPVATKLRAAGHLVFAPSLDGCGERADQLRPGITTETQADELAKFLWSEDLQNVVVVGTSAGGMVMAALAERARARIARLVFADALALLPGERIRDIVTRYPVDGVHLDYIRYPGVNFDFSTVDRTAFELRYGIDPLGLLNDRAGVSLVIGEDGAELLDSLRVEWRVEQVDSLVHMIRVAVGDLPLSAAVFPDFGRARYEKGQDWIRWVQNGDLDFVVPMAYSYKPGDMRSHMQMIKRMIGAERFLVGLPVFEGRQRYLGYSVSLLRAEGILGYCLFSYNALAEEDFSVGFLEKVFLEPFVQP